MFYVHKSSVKECKHVFNKRKWIVKEVIAKKASSTFILTSRILRNFTLLDTVCKVQKEIIEKKRIISFKNIVKKHHGRKCFCKLTTLTFLPNV